MIPYFIASLAFHRVCMASHKRVHTTAASRLRQDYLRIVKDPVPYITALPLPSNILEWFVRFVLQINLRLHVLIFVSQFIHFVIFLFPNSSGVLLLSCCRHYVVRGPENTPYAGT